MAMEKHQLKASLAQALSKRGFRLETLDGQIPRPKAETLALAAFFCKRDFGGLGREMEEKPDTAREFRALLVECMGKKKLTMEEQLRRVQAAFIKSGVFADYLQGGNPGIIMRSLDIEGFPLHVVLSDSGNGRVRKGTFQIRNGYCQTSVNLTAAAGNAGSFIKDWMDSQDELADDEQRWKAFGNEPAMLLADCCYRSVLGRTRLLAWESASAEDYVARVVSLFASSSAVHEASHVLELKRNGKADGKIDSERCAHAMQILYAHPGAGLWSAEMRDGIGALFPELVKYAASQGRAMLGKGGNALREIVREIIDADFKRVYGRRHNEVIDTAVLKHAACSKPVRDEDSKVVMKALHAPE